MLRSFTGPFTGFTPVLSNNKYTPIPYPKPNPQYPVFCMWRRSIRRKSTFAVTCPGQGIVLPGFLVPFKPHLQTIGPVLDQIDEALGEKFTANLFNPSAEFAQTWLRSTSNAQPAILLATYIIHYLFRALFDVDVVSQAKYILGHSLGEYLALCLNGVLDVGPAVQLVRKRGQLMEALQLHDYGMVALLIRPQFAADVVQFFTEAGVVANINGPQQLVISGLLAPVNKLVEEYRAQNAKHIVRVVPVPVTIPFHSPRLRAIEAELAHEIAGSQPVLGGARTAMVSNLTAAPAHDAEEMVRNTIDVNSRPVLWAASVDCCRANGVTDMVNLGPGEVVHNLNARLGVRNHAVGSVEAMEAVLSELVKS